MKCTQCKNTLIGRQKLFCSRSCTAIYTGEHRVYFSHSKESIEKIRENTRKAMLREDVQLKIRTPRSEEFKQKCVQREARKDKKIVLETFYAHLGKWSKEHPEHMAEMRKHKTYTKVSSLEKKVGSFISSLSVEWVSQFRIFIGNTYTDIDNFIPSKNVCIYCDGDYYHSLPGYKERDERANRELDKQGYTVLRFTETDIRKNFEEVKKIIVASLA